MLQNLEVHVMLVWPEIILFSMQLMKCSSDLYRAFGDERWVKEL